MNTGRTAQVAAGDDIALEGKVWRVRTLDPVEGRAILRDSSGASRTIGIADLISHQLRDWPASGRQSTLDGLSARRRELLALRMEHLLEAETGFRSGDPQRPARDEPRPQYDPRLVSLMVRRRAKVAELKGLGAAEARMLGLANVSERTLQRWSAAFRRNGIEGLVSRHWLRPAGMHGPVAEQVREAIAAVHLESLHRSRISMRSKERLVHQYLAERCGPQDARPPSYWTLRRIWRDWYGLSGQRQRYARSAAQAAQTPASGVHVVVHRPGQVIAMDTTVLPVKVRETVFGDAVSAHLTLALDVFSHSVVGFRLTLVSETSVDVAMVIREVMLPRPMREDWGEEMAWPYPGVPASVVAEFAGYPVAALPFFRPETITVDHGPVYKNHHLVRVQQLTGISILPSRILRPADKQQVERAFSTLQSLLFELLPGFTGVDVADRGADPAGDAVLTLPQMEHLIATFVVRIWQYRVLGECAPAWDPGGKHSPNTLFATAISQGGFAMQIPSPDLYYGLLPSQRAKVSGRRGVKVKGRWFDGSCLDDLRAQANARVTVHFDPRDPRFAYHQDKYGQWHTLRWNGLGPEDAPAAFSAGLDPASRHALLDAVARAGLAPRTDDELRPQLLELLAGVASIDSWPGQKTGSNRRQQSRQASQITAAQADRPGTDPVTAPIPAQANSSIADAVSTIRRQRRELASAQIPDPATPLGETLRMSSRLLIPPRPDTGDTDG